MGPFALVAQTTRLLGQVIRHVTEDVLNEEEVILLDRALSALSVVVTTEGELQNLQLMNQQTICTIALMALHEAHAAQPNRSTLSGHFKEKHQVATSTSHVLQSIDNVPRNTDWRPIKSCVAEASPFLVTLLYQIAIVNQRLHKEEQSAGTFATVEMVKLALARFDSRWKAAGAYLKVVEAREMPYMN